MSGYKVTNSHPQLYYLCAKGEVSTTIKVSTSEPESSWKGEWGYVPINYAVLPENARENDPIKIRTLQILVKSERGMYEVRGQGKKQISKPGIVLTKNPPKVCQGGGPYSFTLLEQLRTGLLSKSKRGLHWDLLRSRKFETSDTEDSSASLRVVLVPTNDLSGKTTHGFMLVILILIYNYRQYQTIPLSQFPKPRFL